MAESEVLSLHLAAGVYTIKIDTCSEPLGAGDEMVPSYELAKLGASVLPKGQSKTLPRVNKGFATRGSNSWEDAGVLQACTTCPRLRPHRTSQSPPGREVRTTVRGVRSSPVTDVSAHLHPSYSGAGVLSAALCDRGAGGHCQRLALSLYAGRPACAVAHVP